MPIKTGDIVLSRLFTVLIYNYTASVVIMLPAGITYLALSGDAAGFFGVLLAMLLLPLPATSLAGFFGYIAAFISKRTKHSTLITVVFTVAFIVLYIWGYSKLLTVDESFLEGLDSSFFEGGVFSALAIVGNAVLLKPVEFSIFALVSLLISAVSYLLLLKNYVKTAIKSSVSHRTVYKAEAGRVNSVKVAFFKKELSKIFSSSMYLMNAGIGVIFRIILGVFALIKVGEFLPMLEFLAPELLGISFDSAKALAVCLVIVCFSSMDTFSASAVSLEGKNLWIVKSMPIKSYDVLFAKTLAHISISAPASVVTAALLLIATRASALSWLVGILAAVISAAVFALFGTVINVALPKFDFENDMQPVKQSPAMLVVMFGQMLWGVLLAVGAYYICSYVGGYMTAALILMLHVIVSAVLYIIMTKVSARRFAKL